VAERRQRLGSGRPGIGAQACQRPLSERRDRPQPRLWYDYPGTTFKWGGSGDNHYTGLPGANTYPTSPTHFQTTWPGADYTAYGRLNEGRLGTTNNGTARTVINNRMAALCTAMKQQGIIIYTMTFGPSPSTATKDLYTACATETDMYFHAATAETLQQAFVTIADELSALRIAE
jgi:hypothetical protein